ncbi:MAG: aminotransferase, partial [Gammaproteobacteria bacterium]|nr:aminotransferase [Gammaproteobacteria bacterium]
GYDHAYYKFYVFLRRETLAPNWNQRRIIESLSGRGVPCFSGICTEIYREKAFVDAGLGPSQPLPTAAKRAEETLLFLVHPTLTASHMTWMASQIHAVLNEAIGAA